MTIMIIILGLIFGAILEYANLNKFDVISGLALKEDLRVAKAIAMAIGTGAILINIEIALGFAAYHIKPFVLGGVVIGGLIFGAGMAILGYCPGTLAVSMGEGALDAVLGVVGGLLAGVVYTLILPFINPILGPNLGAVSLYSLLGSNALFFILLFPVAIGFIAISLWLHKIDRNKTKRWIYAGIGLGLLNMVVFASSVANRPIGASTAYPYLADLVTGLTKNNYFNKIKTPGNWEVKFLFGAFLAGLLISLLKGNFKLKLVHENWLKHKGSSGTKRAIWAFIGGFLLILGARMAGGCTSGHILSGGMQLAFSSLTFAVFVFISLLFTGKLFYNSGKFRE